MSDDHDDYLVNDTMSQSLRPARRVDAWLAVPPVVGSLVLLLLLGTTTQRSCAQLVLEEERLEQYRRHNYTWPPSVDSFVPNTPGWIQLMTDRLAQIAEIDNSFHRYDGYHFMMHAAFLCPNFTEYGFGLARAPETLTAELQQGIHGGLDTATDEGLVEAITGPTPKFIQRPDLLQKVLAGMQPYVEAWAGLPLVAYQAYGFRLYQNNSQLLMHYDRMDSHIISLIYHIDSSADAEPWPIFIEDFHGRTHQVILTPGDILFYESSKCAHGRPLPFHGSWYTSVFVHYHPVGWPEQHGPDVSPGSFAQYRIPPTWADDPQADTPNTREPLKLSGMSMFEPFCPNSWCRTQHTIQWSGPGRDGVWKAPDGSHKPLVIASEQSVSSSSSSNGEL